MKKFLTLLAILLIAVFAVSACSSATPEPTEAPVVEEPAEEPKEEPMEEPTEEPMEEPTEEPMVEPVATLVIWADDTRSAPLLELADEFLAAYNVEVIVEEVAGINEQFPIAAPAGEGPDITLLPHDQVAILYESGLLAPINLGAKAELFLQSALDAGTLNGQLYGMPFSTENMGFFRNTDLVPDAPATWDEVYEVGKALMDEGKVTYGMSVSGTTYDAYPLQTAYGAYIFGKDDAGNWNPDDLGVDSEGMIAAADKLAGWVEEGFISESADWESAHVLFETLETPFIMAGPWALERIRNAGVPYAISEFPAGTQEGYPFSGVQVFILNAFSENVLLAEAFLTEFVATEEVMTKLYQSTNRASAFISVREAIEDPDLKGLSLAGVNAQAMPNIPEMGSVWGSWSDGVTLAMQGELPAAEAMADAGTQIRALFAGAAAGMVNVPGSWQAASGACDGDWDPACEGSALTEGDDGLFTGTFDLPAGDYEVKVAHEGGWDENYGIDGAAGGDNYTFTMDADGQVTFTYDPETHILTIEN